MGRNLSTDPTQTRWNEAFTVISRLFRQDRTEHPAAAVYMRLVQQSRRPEFYLHCGVPDTLDGRFDMLVLHVFVVLDRLAGQGEPEEAFAQSLFDHLFADMDVNLREMGVGDLSVGKKVRQMAEAFYGRAQAYHDGLQAGDDEALGAALRRNLFRSSAPENAQVRAMTAYLRREWTTMATVPFEDVLAARISFGPAPVPSDLPVDG